MKYLGRNMIKDVICVLKFAESYIFNRCYLGHVTYTSIKLFLKGIRKNSISVIQKNHVQKQEHGKGLLHTLNKRVRAMALPLS